VAQPLKGGETITKTVYPYVEIKLLVNIPKQYSQNIQELPIDMHAGICAYIPDDITSH
jgi:hypothetical protein